MAIQFDAGKLPPPAAQAGQTRTQAAAPQDADPARLPHPPAGDSVSLSAGSGVLREQASALAAVPVIDEQRVDGIARAIENGAYRPDAGRVAAKLLGFESMME
jgi:negative regulator of flagellin synthesis FlgM